MQQLSRQPLLGLAIRCSALRPEHMWLFLATCSDSHRSTFRWLFAHPASCSAVQRHVVTQWQSRMQVPLQMTLLDFGLAEELTPAVRHHFISFLHAIAAGRAGAGVCTCLACLALHWTVAG
jgi:hypothetical protein